MFTSLFIRDFRADLDRVPKIMFTVFNGGKELGSKVKFSKFYLIMDFKPNDLSKLDPQEVYFKIC